VPKEKRNPNSPEPRVDRTFQAFVLLMDTLVAQFGTNCQVSLYDMREGPARLIAVSGTVMDVPIGSRLAPPILEKLNQANRSNSGRIMFTSTTPDGRRLSSSLTMISDPATGGQIGVLKIDFCIEHLISSIDVLQTFCGIDEQPRATEAGGEEDIGQIVESIIAETFESRNGTRSVSGKEYRLEIVRRLEDRGVFRVKGAVEIVSNSLNVSKYSIYNYIDQVRKARSPQ
jgi:predicted transcriptional regulator YheO